MKQNDCYSMLNVLVASHRDFALSRIICGKATKKCQEPGCVITGTSKLGVVMVKALKELFI